MIRAGILLSIGCLLFFLYPNIDLWFSSFFYKGTFFLKQAPLLQLIYKVTIYSIALFALGLLLLLVYTTITKKELVKRSILVYLLLTLVLGPGLIVNELLKNHMGRARPSQITNFGGTKTFTPALVPSNQCQKNCSFSSGHAAAAFYFVALVPLVRRKLLAWILALSWGWIVGLTRIAQGGHFLSDVYCSMVIDILVAGIMYHLILERKAR